MKFLPSITPPDNTGSSAGQKAVPYAVNFGGWVRAAIPASGTTSISSHIAYQAQSAGGGPWHNCNPGARCDNLDRNVGFANAEPYVFPTRGWEEPEVTVAIVAHTYGPRLRIGMTYSSNLPYCQSLVWDRLEHNRGDTLAAMVPVNATIVDYGVRARDGNNGAKWAICSRDARQHCKDPGPGELNLNSFTAVEDGDGRMKGYVVNVYNGNSQNSRNVELFINYRLPDP